MNRIVLAPYESGYARQDGHISDACFGYYLQRAHGNVSLIITEPVQVLPPIPGGTQPHLGLYDDKFVSRLANLAEAVHVTGSRLIVMLDGPAYLAQSDIQTLQSLAASFLRAARRIKRSGCDGVALSAADGGILHTLISPLSNPRTDRYGGSATRRLNLAMEIIEGVRTWNGGRFLIVFRMVAEEFDAQGISMQDARVNARRLVGAGVNVLDVRADTRPEVPVARFPGWQVPLAGDIKRVMPDVPIIGSGALGDPRLADSVVREGSVDLVMLGTALRENPYWPHIARIVLSSDETAVR